MRHERTNASRYVIPLPFIAHVAEPCSFPAMIKRHTMIYKGGMVASKPKLLRSVICHVLLRKIASFITTYVSTDRDNASLLKRDVSTLLLHAFSSFSVVCCKLRRNGEPLPTPASLFTFTPSQPIVPYLDPQFVFLTCPDTQLSNHPVTLPLSPRFPSPSFPTEEKRE